MILAASYTGNQDASGFTATVSGTNGFPVSVFYTPADRPWPLDPWICKHTHSRHHSHRQSRPRECKNE